MQYFYSFVQILTLLTAARIASANPSALRNLGLAKKKARIDATFEDSSLGQRTIFTSFYGLHFDGFVSLTESPVEQLILFDGDKAAVPAPSGNEVRTDFSDSKYNSINLKSVSVGCFLNKDLSLLEGAVPLSSLSLAQLAAALQSLSGAASTAEKCTVRARVLGMIDDGKFSKLKGSGRDFKDCDFTPTLNLLGQGTGEVQKCDLTRMGWTGVTRLNFTIESVDTISIGAGGGIGNTVPVIDDLIAVGRPKVLPTF